MRVVVDESSLMDGRVELREAGVEIDGRSTKVNTTHHRRERSMKEPATAPSAAA
jgi:hypothetical protein